MMAGGVHVYTFRFNTTPHHTTQHLDGPLCRRENSHRRPVEARASNGKVIGDGLRLAPVLVEG